MSGARISRKKGVAVLFWHYQFKTEVDKAKTQKTQATNSASDPESAAVIPTQQQGRT